MILPITRILLLSTILGGFAVSASFAQGTPGGQGQGQGGQSPSGQSEGMQGGGWRRCGRRPGCSTTGDAAVRHEQAIRSQAAQHAGPAGTVRRPGNGSQEASRRRRAGGPARRRAGGEMDMNRGRHEGRHRRDARFRYYHGGFWYADPWWTVVVGNDRHVRWCRRHYPNYRAGSNTYITPLGGVASA